MTDNEFLQSLLSKGGDVTFPAVNPRTGGRVYDIEVPLVLESHTHVILDGCTLRLADRVYSNIFISRGVWDGQNPEPLEDISIIGKNGALLDGGLHNGLWERFSEKDGNPPIMHNTFILFSSVRGFRVENLSFTNPRYWNMTFYYCSEGVIRDISFDSANNAPNQDGIDLRRGCHDILVENIVGSTGDDSVALTGLLHRIETRFLTDRLPSDIHHVKIRNISTEVTGGHGIVRLLCQDGIKLHDIEVSDIYDRLIDTKLKKNIAAIRIGDSQFYTVKPAEPGDLYNVTVRNVTTNAPIAVKVNGEIPNLTLENIVKTED